MEIQGLRLELFCERKYVLQVNHLEWSCKQTGIDGNRMVGYGEKDREAIRSEFDRSVMIDFHEAKITSDTGFLLLKAIGERFGAWVQSIDNRRIPVPGSQQPYRTSRWSGRGYIRYCRV